MSAAILREASAETAADLAASSAPSLVVSEVSADALAVSSAATLVVNEVSAAALADSSVSRSADTPST